MIDIYRYFWGFLKGLYGRVVAGLLLMSLSALFAGFSIAMLYPVFDKVFSSSPNPEHPVSLVTGLSTACNQASQALSRVTSGNLTWTQWWHFLQEQLQAALNQADKLQVLHLLIWTMLLLMLLKTVTRYLFKITFISIELELVRRLRNHLFAHLMQLSLAYFSRNRTGDLLSRVINDVEKVRRMIISNGAELLFNLVQAVIYLALAFSIDVRLTLLSLLVFPLFAGVFQKITKRLKRYAGRSQSRIADVTSALTEAFQAMRVIIAHDSRDFENQRFARRTEEHRRSEWKLQRVNAGIAPLSELLSSLITVFILWLGEPGCWLRNHNSPRRLSWSSWALSSPCYAPPKSWVNSGGKSKRAWPPQNASAASPAPNP